MKTKNQTITRWDLFKVGFISTLVALCIFLLYVWLFN